jgi:hypothetical protein
MTDQDDEKPIGFEDGMARLEALVAELEAGDLALEDALRGLRERRRSWCASSTTNSPRPNNGSRC